MANLFKSYMLIVSAILLFGACSGPAHMKAQARYSEDKALLVVRSVTDSDVRRLVDLMSGEFDSLQQMQADEAAGVEGDKKHSRVNRYFMKIDAPQIGDAVLVGSTRYGGPPDWYFDKTEFLVWTVSVTENGQHLKMSPRRFKDLEPKIPFAKNANAFLGVQPVELEKATSGAACDIIWTRDGNGFLGESLPCKVLSTTQGVELNWSWKYQVLPDALWVEFSGATEKGEVLFSTPKGSPYRLDEIQIGSAE